MEVFVFIRHELDRQLLSTNNTQLRCWLLGLSGNPCDACLRFPRQMGVEERRSYREWTKTEQQRLLDLM